MATTTKKTAPKTTAKAKAPAKAKATAKAKAPAKAKAKEPTVTETRDARVVTLVQKDFTFGGEGTVRRQSWDALTKALTKGKTTVAKFKELGGKVKYLSRWEAAGAVKIAA